uniref:HeH/LEM domain-containing protein n=1 Tax=viral metagenome TaxID=1070528 RepID=A0A6C0F6S7_9ZZZZ
MQLTYVAVVILASMVFVLSGMVGYLYWQQTRMLQHLQSLAAVLSTHLVRRPEPEPEPEHEHEPETEETPETEPALVSLPTVAETVAETDDDRLSVDKVDGPPAAVVAASTEDVEGKTAAQLRELLTQKSIPFGKRDSKAVLLQLLKATA